MKLKDLVVRRLESVRPAGVRSPRARRRSAWLPEALEPRTLLAASLVKDINVADVTISAMLGVGSREYYAARNGAGTVDLFLTDGTAGGTSKLATFAATAATAPLSNLTSVGSQVYFTIDQGSNGLALWTTDGTSSGTVKVKDVPPQGGVGASTWYPSSLTAVGNRLYFVANDGLTGSEVWTSDGTTAGTVVLDAVPGPAGLNPTPGTLLGIGSTLYVSTASQLYKYDGTTSAPVAVPGAPAAASGTVAAIGTKLFYTAAGQPYGLDTATNTPVALGVPTVANTFGETVVGSTLFFSTLDSSGTSMRLWSSNGTAAGTRAITTSVSSVTGGVAAGNSFVFTLDDGSGPALWKSDGTAAGTVALTAGGSRVTNPSALTASGTRVYYTRPGGSGPALWMTETAPGGISLQLLDLTPFAGGGDVRLTSGSGGSAYLAFAQTTDGVGRLVRSDGTVGGSAVFREFTPAATLDGNPRSSVSVGPNRLLFIANDTTGNDGLWVSDGTTAGTTLLQSFSMPYVVTAATPTLFNGRAYFLVRQGNYASTNVGLWSSDGASASLVVPINRLQGADSMVTFNGALYFNTTPDGMFQPTQLRKSDGTVGGTSVLQTFNGSVTSLVDGGARLYMTANNGGGAQLWALAAGGSTASPVLDGNSQPLANPSRVTMVGQTPFVVAGAYGAQRLYRINPTTGVASVVTDAGSNPIAVGNTPYLAANGATSTLVFNGLVGGAPVLWVVGTTGPAGVVTLGGQPVANPGQPVALGTNSYFAADGANGRELYKFDGNTAALLKDVNPGAGSSNPTNLAVVGSSLIFLANDGVNGNEPWISDGTTAGTMLAANVAAGSAGAFAGSGGLVLGQVNGRVMLAVSDGFRGVEPWSMVINAPTNTAPTLGPIANQTVLANQTLTFQAVGSDVDAGQTLTYSLVNAPAGAQINPVSGVFTWTPTVGGNFTLTVQVTDSGSPALSASRVVNVTVNSNTTPPPAQSTTTLGLSTTATTFGQPVTFTATIGSGGANPGGSVTFVSGATVLGSAPVNGTTAAFTTSTLPVGAYTVQAVYSGATSVLGSYSNIINLNVGPAAATTTTTLSTAAATVAAGQPVVVTVAVSSSQGTPNGNVTVYINGGWQVVANLVNGVATATWPDLPTGNYTFTAQYDGNGAWAASSTPGPQTVTVQGTPTSTSLAVAASTVAAGQPVVVTVTVGSGQGTPTGNVTVYINGGWQVVANLVNGVATATWANLPTGNYTFTAQYDASGQWAASASGTQSTTVADLTTTILPGGAGLAVRPKGNGIGSITLTTSRALSGSSAQNAANYTLYVGRKVKIKGKTTIVYDRPLRPTAKYVAGSTAITLTPPGGKLVIPAGVNAKLVVNGLVDNQNRAVTPYAVFFGKGGLIGVTTASVVRVPAGPAALIR